eukprot:315449-Pyramimonas_sp.AAC.1
MAVTSIKLICDGHRCGCYGQTATEREAVVWVEKAVAEALRTLWPSCTLRLFGSRAIHLSLP